MADLCDKLCELALLRVGVDGAASQVSLEIVEDDFVAGDHHPTQESEETPVLSVDATIGV